MPSPIWQSVRHGPRRLTHKEAVALSGEIYREFVEAIEDDPGKPETWVRVEAANIAATQGRFGRAALMIADDETIRQKSMEERFGFWAGSKLATLGFLVDDESRRRVIEETGKAMRDAAGAFCATLMATTGRTRAPNASPSGRLQGLRRPRQQHPWKTKTKTADGDKLLILFGKLAKERGYAPKTVSEWTRSVQSLTEHAKTDDASAITPEAISAWMDMLVEKGRSAKTINETYFAAISLVNRSREVQYSTVQVIVYDTASPLPALAFSVEPLMGLIEGQTTEQLSASLNMRPGELDSLARFCLRLDG